MRVALLGTGKMGAPIARRLAAAGHELALWNRTLEKARSLGVGRVEESPAAAAAGAEVVLSILTDARAVRDVYARLEPDTDQAFVEMSTAGPDVLDELVERFAHLVAAPIVGSVPAIEQGKALILTGGEASDVERVKPVLAAFGEPQHVGSRREAAGLKLLNNAMLETYATKKYVPTVKKVQLSASERLCLTQAIYHEARGESEQGQWAVANVTIRRRLAIIRLTWQDILEKSSD